MAKLIEVGDRVEVTKTFWKGYRGTVQTVSDDDGWGGRSVTVKLDYPPAIISIKAVELSHVCPLQRLSEIE